MSEIALRIRNLEQKEIIVFLEPWGEQYAMPPGATWKIEGNGPDEDMLEIHYSEGKIVVWGWPGSLVAIKN